MSESVGFMDSMATFQGAVLIVCIDKERALTQCVAQQIKRSVLRVWGDSNLVGRANLYQDIQQAIN